MVEKDIQLLGGHFAVVSVSSESVVGDIQLGKKMFGKSDVLRVRAFSQKLKAQGESTCRVSFVRCSSQKNRNRWI